MHALLVLLPVALFLALLLYIGYRANRRLNTSASFQSEYFLGSRSLGGVVLAMTLVATYGSVSTYVSGPGLAWGYGLGWVVFAAPQIITGFLILGVLGKKMAVLSRRTDSLTVIDLVSRRYDCRSLSILLSLVLLVFFSATTVGQFVGGAQIFAAITGLDYKTGLIMFAAVTVLYTAGGYRAVVLTDAVCAVLMLTGMFLLGYVILHDGGGLAAVMAKLQTIDVQEDGRSALLSYNAGGALPLSLLFSATIICGALMIGLTLLGVFARAVIPELPKGGSDALIPELIVGHMHPLLAGITIIGPLAATMSTVSSLLIAACSAVMRDLYLQAAGHPCPDAVSQKLSKIMTVLIGAVCIILALYPLDVVAWINLFAFGGLESAFLWPLVLGLFMPRMNKQGALLGVICGLGVYTLMGIFKLNLWGWHNIAWGCAAGFIASVVGMYLGPRPSRAVAEVFFPHKAA